jgi:hypothetical protein
VAYSFSYEEIFSLVREKKITAKFVNMILKERNILFEIVTDAMQRESAIADDYWQNTLKHGKKDKIEVALQNLDRK